MKIWTLMENTACREDLRAEHGLSLYLETNEHRILFDAGQTGSFADNAVKLGIDLRCCDLAVLSHGHYDHSGGLMRFLELNSQAPIYLNRYALEAHYNAADSYIGIDSELQKSDRLVFVDDEIRLDRGLSLHACLHKKRSHRVDSFGLSVCEAGERKPDDFRHEQYLLIEEAGKRVLISGCSHKGIRNIVEWFMPDVLIGGFHFMKLDPDGDGAAVLQEAAEALLQYPTVYYTGHCTGAAQYVFLKKIMGDRLHSISTGTYLEI